KVILPVAFFEKLELLFSTSIETFFPLFLIAIITSTPVVNSAAIPCTAQNMDLKGFWLIHLCLTITTHLFSLVHLTLTPVSHAEGSLNNKNLFSLLGSIFIFLCFIKLLKINNVSIVL